MKKPAVRRSRELTMSIIKRVENGEDVTKVCSGPAMPRYESFRVWMFFYGLIDHYRAARRHLTDRRAAHFAELLTAGATVKQAAEASGSCLNSAIATGALSGKPGLRTGERHHKAKLSDADVMAIREMHANGVGYGTLAKRYRASKTGIAQICRGEMRAQ